MQLLLEPSIYSKCISICDCYIVAFTLNHMQLNSIGIPKNNRNTILKVWQCFLKHEKVLRSDWWRNAQLSNVQFINYSKWQPNGYSSNKLPIKKRRNERSEFSELFVSIKRTIQYVLKRISVCDYRIVFGMNYKQKSTYKLLKERFFGSSTTSFV